MVKSLVKSPWVLVDKGTVDLGQVSQESLDVRWRRRSGGHVGARGMVSILISGVLHLHQLSLGGDVAVAE